MGNDDNSSGDKLKGLSGCKQKPPKGEEACQQPPKHWVAVRLRYKDDKKVVWAADCVISQGNTEVNADPLVEGTLEATNLDAGSYEVSFTNIHPDEWEPE